MKGLRFRGSGLGLEVFRGLSGFGVHEFRGFGLGPFGNSQG